MQDIQIVESIGKAFDDAAVEAVKKWRFTPGTYAGRSVPVHTRATLNFRLVGASQPAVATASVSEAHDGQFQKLEAIKVEKPVYPLKARQEGIQGEVWLKRLVATSGDVEHVEVISGDPLLAKAATKAAKRWKFKPFIRDGRAVEVATKIPFDFAFKDRISDTATPMAAIQDLESIGTPPRVHLAQALSQELLLHRVQPVYPESARQSRIQGAVVMRAVIGKDGRIRELVPLSGPRELIDAAVGAVEQWRFKPYMLNNSPAEVETQITVNFQLTPM